MRARAVFFLIFLYYSSEKILSNVNGVVSGQFKSENSSLPVAVRVSKTRVLKEAGKGCSLP